MSDSSESSITSISLLDRVKAQDPVAWQRLNVLYSPLIYSWTRRLGLNSEDSADVLQEVFRAVFGSIGVDLLRLRQLAAVRRVFTALPSPAVDEAYPHQLKDAE